jgi:hypothetical protein
MLIHVTNAAPWVNRLRKLFDRPAALVMPYELEVR